MNGPRTLTANAFLCLTLLAAACSSTTGTDPEYGVVASPPLPIAAPLSPFDPSQDLADLDGSTVVSMSTEGVHFRPEAREGEPLQLDVPPDTELRAVSADGSMTALFRHASNTSHITVVDNAGSAPLVETFELSGLVEPEAFSTDHSLLYVIDHQAGGQPGAYRVRPFNLQTGQLENILGPSKLPFADEMNGVGRRQIWAPDGRRLYTLYIRQTHHHHPAGSANEAPHGHSEPGTDGFVHVLDLEEEWAFCLDLPEAFGSGDLDTTALAVAPDGRSISVVDLNAEQVAYASTEDLRVTGTRDLPRIDVTGSVHIGQTQNQLAIGSGTELRWFDIQTMNESGEATTVSAPLVGFTAMGPNRLLAWTTASVTSGPVELAAPTNGR